MLNDAFHYVYETTRDEFVEGCMAIVSDEIPLHSKWKPSVPLLLACGIGGGLGSLIVPTLYGRLVCFLTAVGFAMLMMISSKQTRMESVRQNLQIAFSKRYDEKKCHSHDLHLDESGLVETCPCGTDTRNWKAIKRCHETERQIVLESIGKTAYVIPKRVIPSAELQPLRNFLAIQVGDGHSSE